MRKHLWALTLVLPALSGCLSHTRKIIPVQHASVVMSADALDLVSRINRSADAIQSLSTTVTIQASVAKPAKGEANDYTPIPGYILMRKPNMLRVLGLVPVLRSHAFDLASNGEAFTLVIPPRSKAYVGTNAVTKKSPNALENLRPNLFSDSLLVRRIEADDAVFVTNETRTTLAPSKKILLEDPDYMLNIVRVDHTDSSHLLRPVRVVRFSRIDLMPYEQDIYDLQGNIETQVLYGPYVDYGKTRFPSTITIKRPLELYQIVLTIEKIAVNLPLTDDQFKIEIPEGTTIKKLE